MKKRRHSFTKYLHTGLALAAFALPLSQAQAAGFYLQEQSTIAMGTSFAGASAEARDASIIYYNPAAMTDLEGGTQISLNADLLIAQDKMKDSGSTFLGAAINGAEHSDAVPTTPLGNFYIAHPLLDRDLWIGLGVSTPFGLATEYNDEWFGRFDSIKSELMTVDIQPSFAYRVNDWFSIGGGVDYQYIDAKLTSAATNGANIGKSTLKGDDWSWGFNAGVLVKPWEDTKLGVHYRSHVYQQLEGKIIVEDVPGSNENTNGHADADLPDIWSVAVAHDLDEKWTLLGQVNFIGWNSFKHLTAVRDTNNTVASSVQQEFDAVRSYAAGFEYHWRDDVTLRAGYQFDESPTNDTYRTTRIPDGDRHHISAGFTYDVSDKFSVNGAAMFGFMQDEPINVQRNQPVPGIVVSAHHEDATYQFISVGLSYKF